MKFLVLVILCISVYSSYSETASEQCTVSKGEISEEGTGIAGSGSLKNLKKDCGDALNEQIAMEFQASITYMAMSAHFSSDSSFRPGLAKFFLKSSAEERMHAKKIMEFLLMRGFPVGISALPSDGIFLPKNASASSSSSTSTWNWENLTAATALGQAYRLEKLVTNKIVDIIKKCEPKKEIEEKEKKEEDEENDYHAVDYLTGEFLAEQHEGLRTISEYITSLQRLGTGTLAEVLFDKTLKD